MGEQFRFAVIESLERFAASTARPAAGGAPNVAGPGTIMVADDEIVEQQEEETNGAQESPALPARTSAEFGIAGIGRLHVVEERLLTYVPGDLAYVENVMAREERIRTHTTTREDEATQTETIKIKEAMESDLQQEESSSLSRTLKNEAKKEASHGFHTKFKSSYGAVEGEAAYTGQTSSSSSRSADTAIAFTQKVVSNAKETFSSEVESTRKNRRKRVVSHENVHRHDNKEGDAHVVGYYYYLQRIVSFEVYEYDDRVFLEFYIPEPSRPISFLEKSNENGEEETSPGVKAPNWDEIPIVPTVDGFTELVDRYPHLEFDAPPTERLIVTKSWGQEDPSGADRIRLYEQGVIEVPEGYRADSAGAIVHAYHENNHLPFVSITVFERTVHFENFGTSGNPTPDAGPVHFPTPGPGSYIRYAEFPIVSLPVPAGDVIPASFGTRIAKSRADQPQQKEDVAYIVSSIHDGLIQIQISVRCNVTQEHREKWAMGVRQVIWNDYLERKQEQDDRRVTDLFGSADSELSRNTAILEGHREEMLKHRAMRLMTKHWVENASPSAPTDPSWWPPRTVQDDEEAIDDDGYDDVVKVLRLAEQGIEWQNMQYTLYPYYWASEDRQQDLSARRHEDLDEEAFLRAGAARILVPIDPRFVALLFAFLHRGDRALDVFDTIQMDDGEGSEDNPWLSIVDELKRRRKVRETERNLTFCEVVSLPTTLVRLQNNVAVNLPPPGCYESLKDSPVWQELDGNTKEFIISQSPKG